MKNFIGVLLFLGMTPPLMAMDAPELSIRPSSERWRESAEKIDEYSYRYKNAARNIQAAGWVAVRDISGFGCKLTNSRTVM